MTKTSNKYSNFKIVWFNDKLESLKKDIVKPPIYVRVKPTNKCNHNCYFCVYNYSYSKMHETSNRRDEIPREKMLEVLKDFKDMGVKALTFTGGGEPLIYPYIEEIMEKTLEYDIDMSIITNAQNLKDNKAKLLTKAKWVRISMDYHEPNNFIKTRRGNEKMFHEIVENIKNFSEIKNDNCDLSVNYIITKNNYQTIYESSEFLKSLNIDNVRYSPVWTSDFYDYHKKIEDVVIKQLSESHEKLESDNFKIYDSYKITHDVTERQYNRCYVMQIIPVVGADSIVYNCHNKAYSNNGIIGSIQDKSFKDMWYSNETSKYFKEFNPSLKCNHQCSNDMKNIIINELINSYGDNFV